jgi:hypothetical protein
MSGQRQQAGVGGAGRRRWGRVWSESRIAVCSSSNGMRHADGSARMNRRNHRWRRCPYGLFRGRDSVLQFYTLLHLPLSMEDVCGEQSSGLAEAGALNVQNAKSLSSRRVRDSSRVRGVAAWAQGVAKPSVLSAPVAPGKRSSLRARYPGKGCCNWRCHQGEASLSHSRGTHGRIKETPAAKKESNVLTKH